MLIPSHQNLSLILAALSWGSFSPFIPSYFSSFICNYGAFIIVYYYDEEYNVFVTIEFSLTIDVMMAESTINSFDQHTQEPLGVNTFLNLFFH